MRLAEYLEQESESQNAFAKRAGLAQQTVSLVCNGGAIRLDTAFRIVEAAHGEVEFEDLRAEEPESVAV